MEQSNFHADRRHAAGRAAADLARTWRTPHVGQVSLATVLTALVGVAWGVSSLASPPIFCNAPLILPASLCSSQVLLEVAGTATRGRSPQYVRQAARDVSVPLSSVAFLHGAW